jgi:hypothetical protein
MERVEEIETTTMGGSPRAEDDGSGRYSKVNAGGPFFFLRSTQAPAGRRHCRAAAAGSCRREAA